MLVQYPVCWLFIKVHKQTPNNEREFIWHPSLSSSFLLLSHEIFKQSSQFRTKLELLEDRCVLCESCPFRLEPMGVFNGTLSVQYCHNWSKLDNTDLSQCRQLRRKQVISLIFIHSYSFMISLIIIVNSLHASRVQLAEGATGM